MNKQKAAEGRESKGNNSITVVLALLIGATYTGH